MTFDEAQEGSKVLIQGTVTRRFVRGTFPEVEVRVDAPASGSPEDVITLHLNADQLELVDS